MAEAWRVRLGFLVSAPPILDTPSVRPLLKTTPGLATLNCWNLLCETPPEFGSAILTTGTLFPPCSTCVCP
ncbi:Uncharacterised protein [Bordetella pertussis]|nr:Uncharacterised protein [Bordetella pertussis]CFW30568.1 Uncharacterised protein [Bordetella pertussis]CPM26023.1 Uncharacterised protein [Bordetella pertussis]